LSMLKVELMVELSILKVEFMVELKWTSWR
jgi:hypothetical protein